jgi:small-conductance mechanosensitive channel
MSGNARAVRWTPLAAASILPLRGLSAWATWSGLALACALVCAHVVATAAGRVIERRTVGHNVARRARGPIRLVTTLAVTRVALLWAPAVLPGAPALSALVGLALVAAGTWVGVRAVRTAQAVMLVRYRLDEPDNRRARAMHTQLRIAGRALSIVVIAIGVVIALRVLDPRGVVTTSLVASAGVVGVVIGVAGRSTLGNLIAGLQIAFTEPIRLDDVVVVEGEWGRIEEVTLTYVVVRAWDDRRLVLPATYFVEEPFQNWTREGAAIVGSVLLWVDFDVEVDDLRGELGRLLRASHLWDGRAEALQVVDAAPHGLQIRALMSAADAGAAFDLRCAVREGLAAYLRDRARLGLPRVRLDASDDTAGAAAWFRP